MMWIRASHVHVAILKLFFKAFKGNTNNTFEHEQIMIQFNSDLINIQLAFE